MNKYYSLVATLLFYYTNAFALMGMPEPESTRIMSAAGAGVGTLSLNDAPLLNPASVVFFRKSSFYYQRSNESLQDKSDDRSGKYSDGQTDITTIIDTSSGINGGISYQQQNLESGDRTRFSASLAGTISESTGLGFILRRTEENSSVIDDEVYNQVVVGLTHVYSEKLVIGFTTIDPSQENSEYFQYTLGVQYTINEFIDIIADMGSGDVANREEESFNKWAIQLNSFKDVYIRYGRFHNFHANRKGTAWGISWMGPRLSLEYANKISELISNKTDIIYRDEKVFESSMNIVVLF